MIFEIFVLVREGVVLLLLFFHNKINLTSAGCYTWMRHADGDDDYTRTQKKR